MRALKAHKLRLSPFTPALG